MGTRPRGEGQGALPPSAAEDKRGVIFPPDVHVALMRGIEIMTAPLAATLGPLGRTVAIAQPRSSLAPEIVADSARIARLLNRIPNRYVNTGAMLIRQLALHMREEAGDGAATAAILAKAMIQGGTRVIAAGAEPVWVGRGMNKGVQAAVEHLAAIARPLNTPEVIAGLLRSATGDQALSELVAEIIDLVGADGMITVEEYAGTMMDREYVPGIRWDTGLVSPDFVTNPARQETVMTDPVIAVIDAQLTTAAQVVPILEAAVQTEPENLVIIATEISGEALGILLINKERNNMPIAPIRAPGLALSRPEILKDLAILTGATLPDDKVGLRLEDYRADYFGRARRVRASRRSFTIVGAKGRQREIWVRMSQIGVALEREEANGPADTLRRRLANLSGGVAILKIGAATEAEGKLRRQRADEAVRIARVALEEGTVPGGGVAYLACIPALKALEEVQTNDDEAMGVRVVVDALPAPLRQLAANAGYDGASVAARVASQGSPYGFDVLKGDVVDMTAARIVDPAKVVRVALERAASTARMVLTTGAVVSSMTEGLDVAELP